MREASYYVCGIGLEHWHHLFFECIFSRKVWSMMDDKVFDLMDRNDMSVFSWDTLLVKADAKGRRKWMESVWQTPNEGFIKINVDASFLHSSKTIGLGVVARYSTGEICFLAFKKVLNMSDSLIAVVMAIRFGLEEAVGNSIRRLLIESDCLQALSEIKKKDTSL
ncbi:hypothetical protein REPUB_Repub01dG0168600 [Reevesia pubescens]